MRKHQERIPLSSRKTAELSLGAKQEKRTLVSSFQTCIPQKTSLPPNGLKYSWQRYCHNGSKPLPARGPPFLLLRLSRRGAREYTGGVLHQEPGIVINKICRTQHIADLTTHFKFFHRGHRKRRSRRSTRSTPGSPRSWRCFRTRTPSWSSRSTSSSPPSSPSSSRRGTSRSSRATTFKGRRKDGGRGSERRWGRSSERRRGRGKEEEAEGRVGVGQTAAG